MTVMHALCFASVRRCFILFFEEKYTITQTAIYTLCLINLSVNTAKSINTRQQTVSVRIVDRGLFPYASFHCQLSQIHEQAEKLGIIARFCFIPLFIIPKLFCKFIGCVYVQEKHNTCFTF
jgi:hypothetical protein